MHYRLSYTKAAEIISKKEKARKLFDIEKKKRAEIAIDMKNKIQRHVVLLTGDN